MSKAYSNKALPSGTVLREWRLEEVLGVGGFGIVYKGRGIYFDELVAIKEYFPSAISERKDGDTVVPIDSNAEEVHALGLKKFVEEAKLLWNLSSPTRHPNIVSVRSLFQIHGTAYMVMDFEDGLSLSRMLKQGQKFNEASLRALIQPIAEGLERAHRVGVLHRDIKPPNILVNEDGRSVLIDFGSARFESGEATSTKVTFHTPPYAPIEQYVKTYTQGPWTDIYALGVVMYECVTGEKPPEVLERMHGGLGTPLADGNWPGYSRSFLAAIDSAMIIRPDERPQSISEWLELFDREAPALQPSANSEDEEATRVVEFDVLAKEIVPVAPPPPGFDSTGKVETAVPENTHEVEFKGPGHTTKASRKKAGADKDMKAAPPATSDADPKAGEDEKPAATPAEPKKPAGKESLAGTKRSKRPLLIGGAALGVLVVAGGGYLVAGRSGDVGPRPAIASEPPTTSPEDVQVVVVNGGEGLAEAIQTLAADARRANAPAAAVQDLSRTGTQLASLFAELGTISDETARSTRIEEMNKLALSANSAFAKALLREVDGRSQRLRRDVPWANPLRANAAQDEPADRQALANDLRSARARLQSAVEAAIEASDPGAAITASRRALAESSGFASAYFRAMRTGASSQAAQIAPTDASAGPSPEVPAAAAPPAETIASSAEPAQGKAGSARDLFPAKYRTFTSTVSSARDIAQRVIRVARGSAPGSDATDAEREAYQTRQANAKTAQGYLTYLDTLTNSMRGRRTEREVDQLISSANQTKAYLTDLQASSSAGR